MIAEAMEVEGFEIYNAETNPSGKLVWWNAPDSWPDTPNVREGRGGSWKIVDTDNGDNNNNSSSSTSSQQQLVIYPAAKKDFWRQTYYEPAFTKDDGCILHNHQPLDASLWYTVTTCFDLHAVAQFDQAGLVVRWDAEHWIKTGIEVVDQQPRLSCVVTNAYSDWSTQAWKGSKQGGGAAVDVAQVEIRVHCRGTSFVVEAKFPQENHQSEDGSCQQSTKSDWEFIRIAHMAQPSGGSLSIGMFACCPEDQKGGFATFHSFSIAKGSHMEHNADGNQE